MIERSSHMVNVQSIFKRMQRHGWRCWNIIADYITSNTGLTLQLLIMATVVLSTLPIHTLEHGTLALTLWQYVQSVGFTVVLPLLLISYIMHSLMRMHLPRISSLLFISLAFILVLNISLFILNKVAIDAILFAIEEPQSAMVMATSVAILLLVVIVANDIPMFNGGHKTEVSNNNSIGHSKAVGQFCPLDIEERNAVIIHEVGHALCFAAASEIVTGTRIEINTYYRKHLASGRVVDTTSAYHKDPLSFLLWNMHTLLAGQEAEKEIVGSTLMGSGTDIEEWMINAHRYLSEQLNGEIYYPFPKNQLEQAENTKLLTNLQKKQRAIVRAFIIDNKTVLRDMAAHFKHVDNMNTDTLQTYLNTVRVSTKFPRIKIKNYSGESALPAEYVWSSHVK